MLLSQPRDELHETITRRGSARALLSNQAVVCRLHAERPAYLSSRLLTVSLSVLIIVCLLTLFFSSGLFSVYFNLASLSVLRNSFA